MQKSRDGNEFDECHWVSPRRQKKNAYGKAAQAHRVVVRTVVPWLVGQGSGFGFVLRAIGSHPRALGGKVACSFLHVSNGCF